ncbi:MAG: GNAT family N-acetyltransferase [Streptosporangiaceae bacterium]
MAPRGQIRLAVVSANPDCAGSGRGSSSGPPASGASRNGSRLAAYRNQGVGGRMLSVILDHARESALARVVLSPSARSVPFYRRAGIRAADKMLVWTP